MKRILTRIITGWLAVCATAAALADELPPPKLQIINGGVQPVDVFWLRNKTQRVPNGTVAPGKETFITTTIGHSFAIVGREDKSESTIKTDSTHPD